MKATFISKENNDVKFTMDFTAEEFETAVVKAYKSSKDRFMVDGFRRGRAPRSIIEKHYGEGIFFEDAINDLFKSAYPQALNELNLDVIDSPSAQFSEIRKSKPFTITISVPVYPILNVKDYKGVKVEQVMEKVKEEDVEKEIEALRKRNARMVLVERPVQRGDMIIFDYKGLIGGKQFDGGTAENQALTVGSGTFLPGFEEQLIGAEKEKDMEINVTFPSDYHEKNLAGKEAVIHCVIHDIKEEQLPELDDEFAKDVSEYDTLDELKEATREKLQKYADTMSEARARNAVIEKIYEANRTDAPKVMVEDEINRMVDDFANKLMAQGMSLDQYLKYMKKDIKGLREKFREQATKQVVTGLILTSVAEAEGIRVSKEEADEELGKMAKSYNMSTEQVNKIVDRESRSSFMKELRIRKVADMLYNEAEVMKVDRETEAASEQEKEDK